MREDKDEVGGRRRYWPGRSKRTQRVVLGYVRSTCHAAKKQRKRAERIEKGERTASHPQQPNLPQKPGTTTSKSPPKKSFNLLLDNEVSWSPAQTCTCPQNMFAHAFDPHWILHSLTHIPFFYISRQSPPRKGSFARNGTGTGIILIPGFSRHSPFRLLQLGGYRDSRQETRTPQKKK